MSWKTFKERLNDIASMAEQREKTSLKKLRNSCANQLKEISELEIAGHGVRFYHPEDGDRSWVMHRTFHYYSWLPNDSLEKARQCAAVFGIKHPQCVIEIFELLQGRALNSSRGWEINWGVPDAEQK